MTDFHIFPGFHCAFCMFGMVSPCLCVCVQVCVYDDIVYVCVRVCI